MVHASWRHGDRVNYNGEVLNLAVAKPHYLLEHPVSGGTRPMSLSVHTVLALDSENPSGADNQQETATRKILADPQRLYVGLLRFH